jgi:hypothetical protein
MYVVMIYLIMTSKPDVVMYTKSELFETIEQCTQESKRILQFKEKGVSIDGMKIKDAICVKEK